MAPNGAVRLHVWLINAPGSGFLTADSLTLTDGILPTPVPTTTPTHTPTGTPTSTFTATPTNMPTSIHTPTPTNTPPPGGSASFSAEADALVYANSPHNNYGSVPILQVQNTPNQINSYLRFNVQNLVGPVTSASLRLYVMDANSQGFRVHSVGNNSWGEQTITYANAPQIGAVINSAYPVSGNNWVEVDVTTFVNGNGLFSFALTSDSATLLRFRSREHANAPQLLIETGNGATATPTLTPSPSQTPSATLPPPTPSPIPTLTPTMEPSPTPALTETPPSGNTFVFGPEADTFVYAGSPATNYGTQSILRVQGTPDSMRSFLRFNVANLDGPVGTATLRLYVMDNSATGFTVHGVNDNSWGEQTTTYNNAPLVGNGIGVSGAVSSGTWVEVDVTAFINSEGIKSLALTSNTTTLLRFRSREHSYAPQLIIITNAP